jgi:hypothetical protein
MSRARRVIASAPADAALLSYDLVELDGEPFVTGTNATYGHAKTATTLP